MNGIQEVSGSIPLISTNLPETKCFRYFFVFCSLVICPEICYIGLEDRFLYGHLGIGPSPPSKNLFSRRKPIGVKERIILIHALDGTRWAFFCFVSATLHNVKCKLKIIATRDTVTPAPQQTDKKQDLASPTRSCFFVTMILLLRLRTPCDLCRIRKHRRN